MEPLCRYCGDVATQVDHRDNDSHNQDMDNLVSMCHACHSHKTAMEQRGLVWRPKGCTVDGMPIDPMHPWNAKDREEPTPSGAPPKAFFHAKDETE